MEYLVFIVGVVFFGFFLGRIEMCCHRIFVSKFCGGGWRMLATRCALF